MSQVRKKIAPPLVGSDIILVIRPGQNINQVLDCTYDQLVQALRQYFANVDGLVPETRTLTINGVTYDLSQDRSWTVSGGGAVDSVNGQTGVVILALDDLSDVNAPSPSVNQILQWNGTEWVPATVSTGVYTADNGLTPEFINPNNFQLGGSLIKSTVITSQQSNGADNLRFDAPSAFINTVGAFQFTAITAVARLSTSVLASFRANDCITAYFETGIILGSSSTAVKIKSINTLSVPLLIEGSLGTNLLKVLDSGQLELAQYNTSTSFQGVSGSSVGILNVDNTGKVFVTTAPTGTGTVTSVGTAGLISGGPITTSGTITTSMNTNKLVGRGTAGVGVMEEITLGTGLSLTGTTLNATGGGGLKSGTATQVSPGVYQTTIAGVTSYTAGDTYIIKFDSVNDGDSTLNILGVGVAVPMRRNTDVKLNSGAIKANQEITVVYDGTNFQLIGLVYDQILAYVHNAEGAIISKGQVVYAYEATGNKMSVKLARADDDDTSAKTIGLVYDSSIGIGGEGYIITQGVIENVDTSMFLAGKTLYLSGTTFGGVTDTKPYAPTHLVYVGIVERANANGQIFVRCQNGYELDEIHDVALKAPYPVPVNNDVLTYITGSPKNMWQARSIGTILGGTTSQYVRGDGSIASFPVVPTPVSVYPYQRTNYYKPSDNRDLEYYNNNLFLINNSGNNVQVVNSQTTLTTVTTGGLTSPNQSSVIYDLATPEVWICGGMTFITRHNASTGAFIANTTPTGSVTSAASSRYVSYSATKSIGGNGTNIFTINPATFVTANLAAHGIGAIVPHLDVNKNPSSAQNDHVMMGGPNGIILFNCLTNAIVLAATTLSGAIGPVYDIKYDSSNDNWIVVCTISGVIKIVYLRPLTATTFTVIKTIDTFTIFNFTLTPGNTQNIKIDFDTAYQYLFVIAFSRLFMYNLSNGDLLKTLNPVFITGGNIQSASAIDAVNKRIFICTGGAGVSITYEYIYA